MLIDNFWKILFVLIIIGGLVFWYKKHRASNAFKYTATELAELIAFADESTPRNDKEAHTRLIKAIAILHGAEQDGIDTQKLVDAAHAYNDIGTDTGHAGLVDASLFENLRIAQKLGILRDETIWDLEEGQFVRIPQGPFKGEKIAVTYHVPPAIGEGARYFIGNLVLVPESVASIAKELEITEDLHNTSIKLVNAKIITQESGKAIKDAYYLQREKRKK